MIDTKKLLFAAVSALLLAPAVLAANLPISWQPVVSPSVRGYRVYYGTSSRNYSASVDVGSTTQYTLTGLGNCVRYYVAVKAYSQSGALSTSYSNEIVGYPTPTVTLVSPSYAEPGQALTINVSGSNFAPGATITLPGSINVLSTTTQSCNLISALISISGVETVGTRSAIVRNPDFSSGSLLTGFTVISTTSPVVRSVSPAPSGMNVFPGVRPSILFSERMMWSSITTATIRLIKSDGTVVPQAIGSPMLDSTGTIAVIVPASPLQYYTQYRVALTGGAGGVRDAQGTALAVSYVQNPAFQTAAPPSSSGSGTANEGPDAYAGVVSSQGPVLEFLSPMDASSLTPRTVSLIGPGGVIEQAEGSPMLDESGLRVVIVPRTSLEPGAVYRARVLGGPGGVHDSHGRRLRSSYEAEGFLTPAMPVAVANEADAPEQKDGLWPIAIDPPDRTSDVPSFVHVAVTFNRPLDPMSMSTRSIRLVDPEGNEVPQAPGSPILEATRSIATILPARPLAAGVAYRVEVLGGPDGVRDDAGDSMSGIYGQVHGFAIEGAESERPTIDATDPQDGERKVERGTRPTVMFSKPLDPGSVDASTIELITESGIAVPQEVGSPFLDGSGTVATIVPAEPLRGHARYRIRVLTGPGGIRDYEGRSMSQSSVSEVRFRTRAHGSARSTREGRFVEMPSPR